MRYFEADELVEKIFLSKGSFFVKERKFYESNGAKVRDKR